MANDGSVLGTSDKGAKPSLVTTFGIRGLHNYKSVSLETDHAASILIAKNGSGKTTLLGAMDAFLKGQFTRLRGLQFTEIFCGLRGEEQTLVLTNADLIAFLELPNDDELIKFARRCDIDPALLFNFLVEEWPIVKADRAVWTELPLINGIYRALEYRTTEVASTCERLRENLFVRSEPIARIYRALKQHLSGVEIVYLPTYRRLELALSEDKDRRSQRRQRPRFKIAAGSLHVGDIQFGLSDIAERLGEMNQKILVQSNQGYREISANIINELIDGSFEQRSVRNIPNREELTLFFSRLQDGHRLGPYYPVAPPNLDKIYSGKKDEGAASQFLDYFLGQLSTVINSTHAVEAQVEEFISRCNKYLTFKDVSTEPPIGDPSEAIDVDAKALKLDKRNLGVHVESLSTGRKISLDALSSGEKQMVSLFAKMYLYSDEKIVLIDEPELSLSIDWQRQILVDVLDAPLCRQVVAITHSPFVFDNPLEPFARSLRVELDKETLPSQNFDEDVADE